MKKLTIVLVTVIVLLLASCGDENSGTYSGAEIIYETARQAGYMHLIDNYDVEILGKYHVSYHPITPETEGASSIYSLEFVENRGKYRNYYSLQELYNLTYGVNYYLVLSITENNNSLPVKIRVSESTYNRISTDKSLLTELAFYNYKDNDNINFVKVGDYFFVVRGYDSTQYEALYLNGEWYNSLYEMPHPYYTY